MNIFKKYPGTELHISEPRYHPRRPQIFLPSKKDGKLSKQLLAILELQIPMQYFLVSLGSGIAPNNMQEITQAVQDWVKHVQLASEENTES